MSLDIQNKKLVEQVTRKWQPVLEHKDQVPIKDEWRKNCTAILLENQLKDLRESAPNNNINNNGSGGIDTWQPILISLVRRTMPNLIAYDICGVQPMTGPTGLIFAIRANYTDQNGEEALFNEAYTRFSGGASGSTGSVDLGLSTDPFELGLSATYGNAQGVTAWGGLATATGEALGDSAGNAFNQMAFTIDKVTVEAKTRALKAEYTQELAQDLKSVHGLDAETELANFLSAEILAETNREIIRRIYNAAKLGCVSQTTTAGVFDLNTDSNGRWSVERFKGLLFQIERECNAIAKETRRGKGNFIVTTSDVAAALAMAGVLDYAPALSTNLNVDDTGNTFAGTINGRLKVYVDPYSSISSGYDYVLAGFRGPSPVDAGMFYCPYVPLQMVRAIGENTFQPKIAFKTRYGLVNNPFVTGGYNQSTYLDPTNVASNRRNQYYRIFKVSNLM